ncbi:1-acyl-sn-glycerol-3-phosphate acyltransferase [Geminocystis sp. NIES-3709]|uniref:lysophospholipid acyltransferase family protein n=1 Tax=Geminocystis sp. NIES-3709 TaxID=1617448 RepID=UPI0005FC41D1|nr:lysophospholipid acyltransferase family protein [Geminocystis sp. NIES-3709]BAQ65267.1 1-acyl-sn-glycerol-3-phosphate acyltransferase [Geminocystis sp. NIES-3709]
MNTSSVQPQIYHHESQITSHISPWLIKLVYPLATRFLFPFFFKKIEITGQENVPKTGAVIIAPTHRSRWDALIVPYATGKLVSGRNPHFMVSANEMKGLQGWFIKRLGGFEVNTDRPGMDSLRHSFDLLCQGEMVVIFPEGNIYRTDDVQTLKRGVAKIALEVETAKPEVEVKILPLTVKYSEPIPQRGCSVSVKIGECLTVKNYHGKSIRESSFLLTEDLAKSLTKNNQI